MVGIGHWEIGCLEWHRPLRMMLGWHRPLCWGLLDASAFLLKETRWEILNCCNTTPCVLINFTNVNRAIYWGGTLYDKRRWLRVSVSRNVDLYLAFSELLTRLGILDIFNATPCVLTNYTSCSMGNLDVMT